MGEPLLKEVLDALRDQRGFACQDALTLGNICPSVYRGVLDGRRVVVKLGLTERTAREVDLNMVGYGRLRAIGAGSLVPELVEHVVISGVPVIIMSDCGQDFWHAAQTASKPVELYRQLIRGIEPVYRNTLHIADSGPSLVLLRDRLADQYTKFLATCVPPHAGLRVRSMSLEDMQSDRICFASFDFKPEDVFVTPYGVKYADPLAEVTGVPVIDLACFAGVARDAHALPGSTEGYGVIEAFAMQEVRILLGLSPVQARRIFALGRALQSALSARFRLEREPHRAQRFVQESLRHMAVFMGDVE